MGIVGIVNPVELRSPKFFQAPSEFFAGRSHVLKQFDFMIEVDQKGLILVAEHPVEEGTTSGALLIDDQPLAQACIHQKAEGEREIVVLTKVPNGLRLAILFDLEVILSE